MDLCCLGLYVSLFGFLWVLLCSVHGFEFYVVVGVGMLVGVG